AERQAGIDPLAERDVVDRRRHVGGQPVMRRVLHDGIDTVELEPGDFEFALLGIELLAQRPQFTEELGARRGCALSIGRRAARPPPPRSYQPCGQYEQPPPAPPTVGPSFYSPPPSHLSLA